MVLVSHMKIAFLILSQKYLNQAFSVKIAQEGIFGPKFRHFCFSQNFANTKIWGCWFQIPQYIFKILDQNYPKKVYLDQNLGIFFCKMLRLDKFKGTHFKYKNIIFNPPPKPSLHANPETPKTSIFVPKFRHFWFFRKILQTDKFEDPDFKHHNSFF